MTLADYAPPHAGILGVMPSRTQLELAASHLDTLPGIADSLGLTHEALYRLERTHEAFPLPIAVFGKARVYSIQEVLDFHLSVGRIYGKGRTLNRQRSKA